MKNDHIDLVTKYSSVSNLGRIDSVDLKCSQSGFEVYSVTFLEDEPLWVILDTGPESVSDGSEVPSSARQGLAAGPPLHLNQELCTTPESALAVYCYFLSAWNSPDLQEQCPETLPALYDIEKWTVVEYDSIASLPFQTKLYSIVQFMKSFVIPSIRARIRDKEVVLLCQAFFLDDPLRDTRTQEQRDMEHKWLIEARREQT